MKEKPVFVSATDGNHGYGLAYAAKLLECDCIIYMPVVILLTPLNWLKNFQTARFVSLPNLKSDLNQLRYGFISPVERNLVIYK